MDAIKTMAIRIASTQGARLADGQHMGSGTVLILILDCAIPSVQSKLTEREIAARGVCVHLSPLDTVTRHTRTNSAAGTG